MESKVNNSERNLLMRKIQSNYFSAYDLQLYLDTHPKDQKAFKMFRELVTKTKQLIEEYEKNYGPLTAWSSIKSQTYNWLEEPWNWEKEANS
ncbi:MAG: spore coat protein CotJB [Oscillospiraceae bacterium]|nr:spore coat protein CotJB [Oscillospiraceae bacterium]